MAAPRDFSYLRGKLVGISDRSLGQHLEIYAGYCAQLAAIEAAYPMTSWGPPGATEEGPSLDAILDFPVASLSLEPIGPIADAFDAVGAEMRGHGIVFEPRFYFGDGDFWTTDRGISINIPWFLSNPTLWRLANLRKETAYTHDQVLRCLRHEIGHAVNYAFELWRLPAWTRLFGDFNQPYREGFAADVRSEDHVEYLSGALAHYAQKHPDEDWAETFATWLDPATNWRERYAQRPAVLDKLEFTERVLGALKGAQPVNLFPGRPESYQRLKGTVRDLLGAGTGAQPFKGVDGWSEHAELLRREPGIRNAVVLHELYFEQFALGARHGERQPARLVLVEEAARAWGSWEAFLLDLRAAAGAAGNGWALVVWDQRDARMRIAMVEGHECGVPAGCPVLLALDVHEHAFSDYGNRRDLGIAAFFRNLDWGVVDRRLANALGGKEQLAVESAPPALMISSTAMQVGIEDPTRKMAAREDLVLVEVTEKRKSGEVKSHRWKRVEEAKQMEARGEGKIVSGTAPVDAPKKPTQKDLKVQAQAEAAARVKALKDEFNRIKPKEPGGLLVLHLQDTSETDEAFKARIELGHEPREYKQEILDANAAHKKLLDDPIAKAYRNTVTENQAIINYDPKRESQTTDPAAGFPADHRLADPKERMTVVKMAAAKLSYANNVGLGGALRGQAMIDAGKPDRAPLSEATRQAIAQRDLGKWVSLSDANAALYRETQGLLEKQGVEFMILYRGTNSEQVAEGLKKTSPEKAHEVTGEIGGMASFTMSRAVAKQFGQHVITVKVPRARIMAVPAMFPRQAAGIPSFLGGSRDEDEVLLTSRPGDPPLYGLVERTKR